MNRFDARQAPKGPFRDAAVAGAIPTAVIAILGQFGIEVPPEVAAAFVTLAIFGWRQARVIIKHRSQT